MSDIINYLTILRTPGGLGNYFFIALDILIIYYLIYRILLLIKGTRAFYMVIGLALISIGISFSRYFGLNTLNWIVDNFINSLILLIVVVFQHDIRRVLSEMGKGTLLGRLTYREEISFYDELMKSSVQLAKKKWGALIVLEKEADLTDYTEGGVKIDARVSRQLIQSIFSPASPIHDGAIIIQEGRVTAAGCFLPLSMNTHIARNMGSRHRAAIGLSEETDAVVIVISEEAGKISLVTDGQITRDIDGNLLITVLQNLFRAKIKSR